MFRAASARYSTEGDSFTALAAAQAVIFGFLASRSSADFVLLMGFSLGGGRLEGHGRHDVGAKHMPSI